MQVAISASNPLDLLYPALLAAQESYGLFPPPQNGLPTPVIVGVSGGADSVSLLHLLARLAQPWHLELRVAHLDHNIRPDSADDAAFVRGLAEEMGLPFHTRRLSADQIAAADNNLEAALRCLRYGFFADVAADLLAATGSLPSVALAHTANDQAETILMHVLRGSGLAGLAGMRPVSQRPVGQNDKRMLRLVRPLLDVPRTHILQYLNAYQLSWREDPSNREVNFTRNRLRHQWLPQLEELFPNLTDALSRLGTVLAAENERAEAANEQALQRLLLERAPVAKGMAERMILDRVAFRGLDLATQRGALRCALLGMGLLADELSFARTENLRLAITGDASGPASIAGGIGWRGTPEQVSLYREAALAFPPTHPFLDGRWRAVYGAQSIPVNGALRAGGWELLSQEISLAELPVDWQTNDDPWQIFCDAQRVGELLLTTPRRGQRFAPLGMAGQQKSLGDFFTDHKIDVPLREGWPLVVDGASGEIVWVCGLRLAHAARLQPQTRRVYHLKWSKQ